MRLLPLTYSRRTDPGHRHAFANDTGLSARDRQACWFQLHKATDLRFRWCRVNLPSTARLVRTLLLHNSQNERW